LHVDHDQLGDNCFNDNIGDNLTPEAPGQYLFPTPYGCMDMEVGPVYIGRNCGHPDHFPTPGKGFKVWVWGETEDFRPRDNLSGLQRTHEPDIAAVYLVVLNELHQSGDKVFSMVYPDNKNPARFSFGVLHDDLIRNYYLTQLKLIDWIKTG